MAVPAIACFSSHRRIRTSAAFCLARKEAPLCACPWKWQRRVLYQRQQSATSGHQMGCVFPSSCASGCCVSHRPWICCQSTHGRNAPTFLVSLGLIKNKNKNHQNNNLFIIYLLKAYRPVDRTGSPKGFSQNNKQPTITDNSNTDNRMIQHIQRYTEVLDWNRPLKLSN